MLTLTLCVQRPISVCMFVINWGFSVVTAVLWKCFYSCLAGLFQKFSFISWFGSHTLKNNKRLDYTVRICCKIAGFNLDELPFPNWPESQSHKDGTGHSRLLHSPSLCISCCHVVTDRQIDCHCHHLNSIVWHVLPHCAYLCVCKCFICYLFNPADCMEQFAVQVFLVKFYLTLNLDF